MFRKSIICSLDKQHHYEKYFLFTSLKLTKTKQGSSNITESLQSLISCFLLGWFITGDAKLVSNQQNRVFNVLIFELTGCFWVYRTFEPDYVNVSSTNYCHPILYTFAFWLLTSTYIIIGLFILCLCCVSGTAILISVD